MEKNVLENIGFSKREARAYLALLELGSSTITDIIKQSEIPGSKIYEVLNRLMEKTYVSYVIKNNKKHFQAADPEIIFRSLEERNKEFKEFIPTLKQKQEFAKKKNSVTLFEGRQTVFRLLRQTIDTAKEGEEYLAFSLGNYHDDESIALFYKNFHQRRLEKKLKMEIIVHESNRELMKKQYTQDMLKSLKCRFSTFSFPQGLIILRDSVITLDAQQEIAIVIESKDISEQYRKSFNELYAISKK